MKNNIKTLPAILKDGKAQYAVNEVYSVKSVYEQLATIDCKSKAGTEYKAVSYRNFYKTIVFFTEVMKIEAPTRNGKAFNIRSIVKELDTEISFGLMFNLKYWLKLIVDSGLIKDYSNYIGIDIKPTSDVAFTNISDLKAVLG